MKWRLLAIIKSMDDKTYKVFLDSNTLVTECDGRITSKETVGFKDGENILQLTFPIKRHDLC